MIIEGVFSTLVAQPLDPPCRAIGYRYTYRTYVFEVSQGIALYPPKFVLSLPRGEGGRGYRSSSCALEGIALYGGIAEIVSPSTVQSATKFSTETTIKIKHFRRGTQSNGGNTILGATIVDGKAAAS